MNIIITVQHRDKKVKVLANSIVEAVAKLNKIHKAFGEYEDERRLFRELNEKSTLQTIEEYEEKSGEQLPVLKHYAKLTEELK